MSTCESRRCCPSTSLSAVRGARANRSAVDSCRRCKRSMPTDLCYWNGRRVVICWSRVKSAPLNYCHATGPSCMSCPCHAPNDFWRGARYGHRDGCYSCFIGPFDDARYPYSRRTSSPHPPHSLPPVAQSASATRKAMSLRSFKKLIGWFELPRDADVTTRRE